LHRFCARMVGSLADGEDVVQNTLALAIKAVTGMVAPPAAPRAWIFQIARRAAIDHLRRQAMRTAEELDPQSPSADEAADEALARGEATRCAIARFVELPPAQRACVIAKDVLGLSLDEVGALLELSVPAVKSTLHRGRVRLRSLAEATSTPLPHSETIVQYARLFNQRNVAAICEMLADDVRLDVVNVRTARGRDRVGNYFTNYARGTAHAVVAWLDGREVLAIYERAGARRARYFIEVWARAGAIVAIRDFVHVPYIAEEADFR
jgi:RNA polymerase sigma factor (sigma-70 family)